MGKEDKRVKRCSTSIDAESSDHKDKKPLHIAESELENPETDGKKAKEFKRCSKATDAESSDHKDKKPLQITDSELQNCETDEKKRKKNSKRKQIDEDDLESNKMSQIKSMKRLKRCSTSTDAESSDRKDKKPLQIAESELENSETDVIKQKKRKKNSKSKDKKPLQIAESELQKRNKKSKRKQIDKDQFFKSKKISEIKPRKRVRKSFFGSDAAGDREGLLKEILLAKASGTPSKALEEESPKKTEELATFECCFGTEDSDYMFCDSLFVTGFGTALPRDVVRAALWKHFESCGCTVNKVFVPIECKTGVPLGFAFIRVAEEQKGLLLARGYMGEHFLRVMRAKYQSESFAFPNFKGCKRCHIILSKRQGERFKASLRDGLFIDY